MSKLQEAMTAYTFDDFMLVPLNSRVKSRKDPNISINIPGFQYNIPIISAPMNTITEQKMLFTMYNSGGVGVLHRYMTIEDQINICKEIFTRLSDAHQGLQSLHGIQDHTPVLYAAVGANGDSEERISGLLEAGVTGICVDVANGHNEHCLTTVKAIRKLSDNVKIMAGNVCTYEGARNLASVGATSIRIGIGPGSMCTTRLVTGHGVPQLSAIEDCARLKTEYPNVALIADGGIRVSGDIIKALAIGADCVMIGSLLGGTEETPGEYIEEGDKLYKYYHGMASEAGRTKWFDKSKVGLPSEGVSTKVPFTGKSAQKVIEGLCQSIKVGLSYSGALSIKELQEKATWRRVSSAGYVEGTPHGKK